MNYTSEDIEKTIILGETDEQLPPFSVLIQTIKDYYPDEYNWNDDEIVSGIYRIIQYVGNHIDFPYIYVKDMVLLKVIMELLDFSFLENHRVYEEISRLEKSFLLHD